MLVKAPFKGLSVTKNVLEREPNTASFCKNVYKDIEGRLRNRPYFTTLTFPVGVVSGMIKGLQRATFRSYSTSARNYAQYMLAYVGGEDVFGDVNAKKGKILRISHLPSPGDQMVEDPDFLLAENSSNNYHEVPCQYDPYYHRRGAPFRSDTTVKGVMLEDVMYFLGIYGLWKYDGLVCTRAGLPIGSVEYAVTTGTEEHYYRSFLATFDFSGQWIFGDYHQEKPQFASSTVKVRYAQPDAGDHDLNSGLFDSSSILCSGAATYSEANREYTVPYSTTNMQAGEYITIYPQAMNQTTRTQDVGSSIIWKIRVKSVTGSEIILDDKYSFVCDLREGGGFKHTYTGDNSTSYANLLKGWLSNVLMAVYSSASESTGYQFAGLGVVYPYYTAHTNDFLADAVFDPALLPTYLPFTSTFEQCYDEGKTKGLLPLNVVAGTTGGASGDDFPTTGTDVKYLTLFNNVLLAADDTKVYFSDTSVGSTAENFDPLDFFIVGDSDDGPITGVFANSEYIIVHREFNSYYVAGNVVTGSYRSVSLNPDRFGAVSHLSQVKLLYQNYYISQKGAHVVSRGGNASDIGEDVEAICNNSLDSVFGSFPRRADQRAFTVSTDDDLKNHVYTVYQRTEDAMKSRVLVYNYRLKEWFYWEVPHSIQIYNYYSDFQGGVEAMKGKLYLSDGFKLFVEGDTVPDAAFGDEAEWVSNFRHDGQPSLEKKYTYLKLFGLEAVPSNIDLGIRFDWESSQFIDQGTLQIPNTEVTPPQGFKLTDLENYRCYSVQFRLAALAFSLDAYELNSDLVQEEMKR